MDVCVACSEGHHAVRNVGEGDQNTLARHFGRARLEGEELDMPINQMRLRPGGLAGSGVLQDCVVGVQARTLGRGSVGQHTNSVSLSCPIGLTTDDGLRVQNDAYGIDLAFPGPILFNLEIHVRSCSIERIKDTVEGRASPALSPIDVRRKDYSRKKRKPR